MLGLIVRDLNFCLQSLVIRGSRLWLQGFGGIHVQGLEFSVEVPVPGSRVKEFGFWNYDLGRRT
jgi:hypothetical protein